MANNCFARIYVRRLDDNGDAPLPIEEVQRRLEALHYMQFDVVSSDDELVDIECDFRWCPPFDGLRAVSADLHVDMLCTYHEDGCCFMGAWRGVDGVIMQNDSIDY